VILQLSGIGKRFGDMVVIPDFALSVEEGEFVGVIGPNGAGKTTLFALIAGSLSCDCGDVRLDGRSVTQLSANARCHAGIGRTFQIPQPFETMTVYENALVAAAFGAGLHGDQARLAARDALDRCGILLLGNVVAGRLTLLQRKRLELARAIATRPRLLLLDEVAGGLTDGEMAQLLELVTAINASGVTVLWIEHLVHALVSVARRLIVMTEGRLIADGEPAFVLQDRTVREVYLGAEVEATEPGRVTH
jgi:branched-chain amino acid transport system ATP-binding protein